MPRSVEHIVACHQAAASRRDASLPIWDRKLPVRPLLKEFEAAGDDLTPEQAVNLSRRLAAILSAGVPAAWRRHHSKHYSTDFEELFERLEQATVHDFSSGNLRGDEPCDVINDWLEELYDWADRSRVWID